MTVVSLRTGTGAANGVLVGVASIGAAVGDATGKGGVCIGPTVSAESPDGTLLTSGRFTVRPLRAPVEFRRGLKSIPGFLARPVEHGDEPVGQIGAELSRRRRRIIQLRVDHRDRRVALERKACVSMR